MTTDAIRAARRELTEHFASLRDVHLRDLFAADPARFEAMSGRFEDVLIDWSKHRLTATTLTLLRDLARAADLAGWTRRMFAGDHINTTEDRAVLHVALRNRSDRAMTVDGVDVMPGVRRVLAHVRRLSEEVRSGTWRGFTGERIRDVVNIGIGGSDLGPLMVTEALRPYARDDLRTHFVSNVDGAQVTDVLSRCRPESTLFLVASKTFTTQETLTNAHTARRWLLDAAVDPAHVARHFVALSTNAEAVSAFGIDPANMLEFWDWVGGRYSLWSAIGTSIAVAVGFERFEALLEGAHAMDEHFRADPVESLPATLALIGIWYADFFGAETSAILPYDQGLHRLPAYLQQADMESNGKRTTRDGRPVQGTTGPIVWGEPGTNGQHAFFQLLHQGTRLVPADFLAPVHSHHPVGDHHALLLANFLAQTEALMWGRTEAEARAQLEREGHTAARVESLLPHKVFPGNRPTTSILFDRLTPRTLGSLIALYEHRIFVQGVVWGVNSFDQWGVELGKQLAARIRPELEGGPVSPTHDASTRGLIHHYRARRGEATDGT